jgi:hypothetical protein
LRRADRRQRGQDVEGGGPDVAVFEWMLVASALAFFGWKTLGLIVPEDRI